ncbi:MAG: hypothetical protein Q9157_004337 [Trypethelium eluteriae]
MSQSSMTLIARSFDLMSALVRAADPASAVAKSTQDLIKWLARERIDELSFATCAKQARGLAYPNENGLVIRDSIEESDQGLKGLLKGAPLNLVISASLGRMMARDVDFCYLVSTVSVLTNYWDPEGTTDILCSMMLDSGENQHGVSLLYQAQRDPIKAVMSKIVESILINVVNTGHQVGPLPDELRSLHPHVILDREFAAIVMGIQRTREGVLLLSDYFIGDVTTWLFYHFDGLLEISIAGAIVLSKKLGPSSQVVRIVIHQLCDAAVCSNRTSIEASIATGDGTKKVFMKGLSPDDAPPEIPRPQSARRKPLYLEGPTADSIHGPFKDIGLNRSESNHICAVAKKMTSWLLDIALEYEDLRFAQPSFKATSDGSSGSLRVRDLLLRHPGLMQKQTGHIESSAPIFKRPLDDDQDDNDHLEPLSGSHDPLSKLSRILNCFPMVLDMLDAIQKRCTCSVCETNGSMDDSKAGCLRYLACEELLVLIAHAISDGLGAKDVSGLSNRQDMARAVVELFDSLLQHQQIAWNDWFRVFSCTASGIPFETLKTPKDMDHTPTHVNRGKSLIASQYGCYVAVVPWVDLQQAVRVKGCFGLELFEGNIKGLPEELAFLQSEQPSPITQSLSEIPDSTFSSEDNTRAEFSTAIFRVQSATYRLVTFVKTATHLRLIDPVQALSGLMRSQFPRCTHSSGSETSSRLQTYMFDDILACWADSIGHEAAVQATYILDDRIKFNVAVALSAMGSVIRDVSSCCLSCAEAQVKPKSNTPRRLIQTTALSHSRLLR